jgi:hypothetical protein
VSVTLPNETKVKRATSLFLLWFPLVTQHKLNRTKPVYVTSSNETIMRAATVAVLALVSFSDATQIEPNLFRFTSPNGTIARTAPVTVHTSIPLAM